MLPDRTAEELNARWQERIAHGLEADQSPAIHLGRDERLVEQNQSLLALQLLAAARADFSTPVVVAGGNSALWPAALFFAQAEGAYVQTPPLRVLYGGADAATVLASRALYADGDRPLTATAYLRPPRGLPAAMVAPVAPNADPIPVLDWEMLPVQLAADPSPNPQSSEDWLAYLFVILAVVLVALAFALSLAP
ncbi:MAG: hypothetical protein KDD92_09665 [Caldilineaceae bacterium]|nr:hypothetical protein [Caldilineaceae bacterium]